MIAKKLKMIINTLFVVMLIMAVIAGCTFAGAKSNNEVTDTDDKMSSDGPYFNVSASEPAQTVLDFLEAEKEQEYTLSLDIYEVAFSESYTAETIDKFKGSDYAKSKNWTDEYVENNIVAVAAYYSVQYDHGKIFYDDGEFIRTFYLKYDDKTSLWSIWDNDGGVEIDAFLNGHRQWPDCLTKPNKERVAVSLINAKGSSITERFDVPLGFVRLESEERSFAYYLQNLPLKPDGTKVKYYDGREKPGNGYLAVVDFTLGKRDLQQCADAVIRLRAEYLYNEKRFHEIHFKFVSGFNAEFSKWADGYGISVDGNRVSWINNNNNSSYESFQKYLDIVYAYASTLSLENELITKPLSALAIGDVFIQGGSPGHCVIVVDMALNENTGEKIFMLAQSYMPAQDIQILKGDSEGSPWFSANIEDILKTPEWTFKVSHLKTWE
ncbi:MAG: DUF4846 domain-containing protein [Clostridia bacterium]|jgi:hypothetical protein|nr:DUF4846 domain-containing protein [Clostridia bacterium]